MITVRQATADDIPVYLEVQKISWGDGMSVEEKQTKHRFDCCLEGILIAEADGRVVGTTTMIRLAGYDYEHPMTWDEATGEGWCDTHRVDGTVCFGVDLSAIDGAPAGTVDALMAGCMKLVIEWRVKYCVLGGRMPAYQHYLKRHPNADPDVYMRTRNRRGRYQDPQVNMYSKVPGMKLIKLIPSYFEDPESCNYGVLWRWRNPFYGIPGAKFWARLPLYGYGWWQKLETMLDKRRLRSA